MTARETCLGASGAQRPVAEGDTSGEKEMG
jgi:hypothetical protein